MNKYSFMQHILIMTLILFCLSAPMTAVFAAIRPDQLLLVVNENVPEARDLAMYYCEKRHVPQQNIFFLKTSTQEEITRTLYEKQIARPLRRFLLRKEASGKHYACLVLFYGMPLRIRQNMPDVMTNKRIQTLKEQLEILKRNQPYQKEVQADIKKNENELTAIYTNHDGAAVDSEIALVMEDNYSLLGWLPNKYFIGFRNKKISGMPQKIIPVCRLDGPTDATVRRIIDDSLYAQVHGLKGRAYFDARWPNTEHIKSAYHVYDASIHQAAHIVRETSGIAVTLDTRSQLFGPGDAPDAALYCGWYSLGKYVDAFVWSRGAIGYHVASAECTTLKNPDSSVWCKKMLEKGIAATLGPVAEPYLQSFPMPEIFFQVLLHGGMLLEGYLVSNPFWSWQMVLIGDPLYCSAFRKITRSVRDSNIFVNPG